VTMYDGTPRTIDIARTVVIMMMTVKKILKAR
jgi:hypothetical protein